MERNRYLISAVLFLLLCSVSFSSYAQFTLSAEVRPRTEFRNGFKTPTSAINEPAFFTEQRSRIYFDYKEVKYRFRISLQDVRVWGEVPQIFKQEDGNTYLSEAWGQYYFTPKASLRIGRQIISYDNQRIIGGLEWAQQGRRHDAFVLLFEDADKKTKLHIGAALNSDDDTPEQGNLQSPAASFYSVAGNYKNMQYAWLNKGFTGGSISLVALNTSYQNLTDSSTYAKQTLGGIGHYDIGKVLSIGGDFYYQMGKIRAADLSAMLAGVNLTIKTKLTPLKVGVEYVSGKDDTDTDGSKVTHFSPDFGTNHAHNGFMDYFFVGPANGTVGVTDFYLKTKFKLKKGALIANFHEFLTGSVQLDENGNELAKPMGFEVDLVYAVTVSKDVSFNLGYSHLLASETMLALRPGNSVHNNWAWMMITFKPTLFQSEKK